MKQPFGGRAQPVRLALALGNVCWEDEYLSFPEFGKLKAGGGLRFGGMPMAEIPTEKGTVTVSQSNAILCYAGKLAGLYPKDDVQAAQVDELVRLSPFSFVDFFSKDRFFFVF